MKAMSELFRLPLETAYRGSGPDWGMAIVEQGDTAWAIEVNPRAGGPWSQTLLVSAQERAEAIVAAVNERDALTDDLATALDYIMDLTDENEERRLAASVEALAWAWAMALIVKKARGMTK